MNVGWRVGWPGGWDGRRDGGWDGGRGDSEIAGDGGRSGWRVG